MFVKVRFNLNNPICYSAGKPFRPPTLDSLLGYVWCIEHGYTKTSAESFQKNIVFPELPIAKTEKCYHASSMFLPEDEDDRDLITVMPLALPRKVIDRDTMAKVDPKEPLDEGRKVFRACMMHYWTITTPYVDFYADVTDGTEFERLVGEFAKLGHIGKKYGIGYGTIRSSEIKAVSYDYSIMKDGFATRPLPKRLFPDAKGPKEYTTYFAPYWFYANKAMCFMPQRSQYMAELSKADTMVDLMKKYKKSRLKNMEATA